MKPNRCSFRKSRKILHYIRIQWNIRIEGPSFFLDLRFICELYSLPFFISASWRTSRAGHSKIDSYRNYLRVATCPSIGWSTSHKLEDLKVLRRSPDLLNNVKIGQGQLQHIMKQILFLPYTFWSSDLNNLMNNPSNSPVISEKKRFRYVCGSPNECP